MKLLTNIIIEYLKHNKRLVVPKLGAFIVKKPGGEIIFSELMRSDDGILRSLLMAYGMKEIEANGAIDRMVFEIRHAVGKGDSFHIDDFGDFRPGPNSTIIFRHHREPIVIGGSIKPPVERLTDEKIKMQRARNREMEHSAPVDDSRRKSAENNSSLRKQQVRETSRNEEEDILSITKPESYLRGLKYDQSKNKKREDDMFTSQQRRSGVNIIIMVIAAIAVGIAIWFMLPYIDIDLKLGGKESSEPKTIAIEQEIAPTDTLMMGVDIEPQDSTTTDSISPNVATTYKESATDIVINQ